MGISSLTKEVFIKPLKLRSKRQILTIADKVRKKLNITLKPILVFLSFVPLVSNSYLLVSLGTSNTFGSGSKFLNVNVGGNKYFFQTSASTVKEALLAQKLDVDEYDLVEPSFSSQLESGINDIKITKAHSVIIYDNGKVTYTKSTSFQADEILKNNEVVLFVGDKVSVKSPYSGDFLDLEIYIDRSPVVSLQVDGVVKEIHTRAADLKELLAGEQISLNSQDKVVPGIETPISGDMNVSVVRVVESENSQTLDIPFTTEYKDDPTMLVGQSRVERAGVLGKKELKFAQVAENGQVVSKQIVSETVLQNPVSQIVIKGTKPKITYASGVYAEWINTAAQKYGVDAAKMSRLMYCESGGNPYSVGGGGKFHGLFQYLESTWAGASAGAGFPGASIYDPEAQIFTTAWKISFQGYRAWPVCGTR